jgi:hypothetical protein
MNGQQLIFGSKSSTGREIFCGPKSPFQGNAKFNFLEIGFLTE